jgi:hypothetical protein
MGMFDSFYFDDNSILPNSKLPQGTEYQTKCLSQDLSVYYVNKDKIIYKTTDSCYGEDEPTIVDYILNNTAYIYGYSDDMKQYQEYKVMFLDNTMIYAKLVSERGFDLDD